MNYFDQKAAAERYSRGRPAFHSNTIKHIKDYLGIEGKLNNALDIACGTGLSTKALLEIATNVYGSDISEEMLKLAPQADKISYRVAPAEQQPFPDHTFDLITVGSGVHWFDIDKFLIEANRLLKSRSWLVLYENHFIAEMVGKTNFTDWFFNVYLKKFSTPHATMPTRGQLTISLKRISSLRERRSLRTPLHSQKNSLRCFHNAKQCHRGN